MATWSDIVPITSPGLGVAAYKAGIPASDLAQVNTWDRLYQKHRELLDIQDDKKAFAEFQSLDPQIQDMLKKTFNANYLHRPKDWTVGRVLGNVLSAANPIKLAGGAFRTISQTISLAPAALKSASQGDFTNFGLLKVWSSDWDGKKIFDNDTATRLDEAYGSAMGVLAKGIVTGKTPGEIISENGGVSKELEFALNYMYDNPDKFKDILSDYKRTQFSVGRFAASFGAGNPVTPFKNTAQEQAFDKISGVYDAIFQIGADPTTYLTFGFGPALKGGSKLAKMWFEAGGFEAGAKAVFEGTGKYSKQLNQYWDNFGPVLKKYKEATTPGAKAAVMREITINFPEHNNPALIKELTEFDYKGFKGVTDAKSAKEFFSSAEHGNPMALINGRTNAMQYYRSNHIAIANKSSLIARDMRNKIDKLFNKETNAAVVDPLVSEISSQYKKITELEELSKSGQIIDQARLNNPAFLESKKELETAKGRIARLASRAPLYRLIDVTDEGVLGSIDVVNATLRTVHPKRIADGLTEVFIAANAGERIAFLRGLFADVLHSSGLGAHPQGINLINEIVGEKFLAKEGTRIKVGADYTPIGSEGFRFETINGENFIIKDGPIGPKDFSTVVGNIDWVGLSEHLSRLSFTGELKGFGKAANVARAMSSIVNGKIATQYTNAWSVLTLFPKLGVRGTVDELFFFVNYAPKEALMNFFSLKGLAGTKLGAASSRTTKGLSFVAKHIQRPQDLVTDKEIEQALEAASKASPFNRKQAEILAKEQIIDRAFTRFVGVSKDTLSDNHIKYLKNLFIYSPHFSDAVSSSVASHMLGRVKSGEEQVEMAKSALTKALEERGYKDSKKYVKIKEGADQTFKQLFHYREFYTSSVANDFSKFGLKKVMAPINYAMKHNGLKTREDLVAAINDMTQAILEPSNAKGLKKYLEADAAVVRAKKLKLDDFTVVRNNAETMLLKMRELLHGSADFKDFNESLYNAIKSAAKGENYIPGISKMDLQTFEQLTRNNVISTEGKYTSLVPGGEDPEALMARVGNKLFELMDAQISSMFRTPAYTSLFLANMDKFEQTGFISSYAKHLEKNMLLANPKLDAEIAAQRAGSLSEQYFTEIAAKDASDLMLKYVDNPEVRTQLAFSMRNGARFYRATEDFIRRVYRMKDVSLRTMMRMRLSAMGLEASGFIHEDQQGQKYVMLPMDNAIFQVIDKPLRVLTGGTSGYSQPLFGDFTVRLAQVNPSFGPDAAMPTLSGPIAGANVWLFKSIIGRFGAPGREVADVMDNALLGNLGDNITLRKAIVPVFLDRTWRILNADEKDKQEVTAIQQAIAYDAAHGKGLSPTATPEEQYEYIKNIRISAHNVVVMRNLLGLMPVPFSPTLKETKDVPNFLKDVGIGSISQEFYDIYENVLKAPNPRLDNPYEEALAIYVGKNPGKLVYTVSRADKDSGIAFQKTDEVKKWYIANKGLVNKYGSAAWLAAPSVGDFSSSAYAWFEAAGMIKNKDLETYLRDVQVAEDKAKYFDIEQSAMEQLGQSNILASTPANIKANMKQYREALLIQNPILKQVLQSGDFATVNEEKMLNNLNYMLNDASVEMDVNTKTKLKQAVEIMNTTLGKIQSGVYDDNPNFKREVRDLAIRDLNILGRVDSNVRQATSSIFIPILKNYSKDSRI